MSIKLKETLDRFKNDTTETAESIVVLSDPGSDRQFGNIGGLQWNGDADEEYLFGTAWLDKLYGGLGSDRIYGFEGDDIIYGSLTDHTGDNANMDTLVPDFIFGDAGDDKLFVYGKNSVASGGSGNDQLFVMQGEDEDGNDN